ncbi:3' terminal RNA ribose 2'-O-methyltransferase Hen1 [Cesiribacter sp. SM1]|uniref:3' terminal RNA ribose 2'-O-methyltransferase Hen1 n=1 Tax=Cesiribacter sp. SM1 TaxID=2861196 RepID=UPI001CD2AB70|nr:3' terminal RNA ribose 2'-O-methyltransferase Hen1 [Cesiribacter sp. SM1]
MLLTITTTHQPATDLGFLLHKHPDRLQSVELAHGKAHIFYPEAGVERCTAALLLDIDPVSMVRGARNMGGDFALGHYVNDRPYVASSFMSVAITKAFSSALNGQCSKMPELAQQVLPLEAKVAVLPAPKGGEMLIRRLFEPLGYNVHLEPHVLDETVPGWGNSKYYTLTLSHTLRLQELLQHLYVLIPVLDNDKHYFVSQGEIDKLLEKGKGWLENHPEQEQIIRRYLLNLGSLARQAMERLADGQLEEEVEEDSPLEQRRQTLHQQRLEQVLEELKKSGAERVIDLGCGEGKLLRMLLKEKQFRQITGVDISIAELRKAKQRLHWDEMAPRQRERIELMQGALTYRDKRLAGYDAAAIVEVIEHLEPNRLKAFERTVFEFAKPKTVVLTTPNSEYNVKWETLEAGSMRHTDHRFEWTRQEFENWSTGVADRNGYRVRFSLVGPEEEEVGAPSQMAVFELVNHSEHVA